MYIKKALYLNKFLFYNKLILIKNTTLFLNNEIINNELTQKYIKDIVANGNVRFETFRVDEKGASLKIEAEVEENFTINSLIPKESI